MGELKDGVRAKPTPATPPLPIYCITTGNSPRLNPINYADGEASSIIKSWTNIRFIERHRGINASLNPTNYAKRNKIGRWSIRVGVWISNTTRKSIKISIPDQKTSTTCGFRSRIEKKI
jgi:hypothetical protein